MYQNCFSIKEMKKQIGGRMMKMEFKHFEKTENYESLVTRVQNVKMLILNRSWASISLNNSRNCMLSQTG
jgi:hypothetical protein